MVDTQLEMSHMNHMTTSDVMYDEIYPEDIIWYYGHADLILCIDYCFVPFNCVHTVSHNENIPNPFRLNLFNCNPKWRALSVMTIIYICHNRRKRTTRQTNKARYDYYNDRVAGHKANTTILRKGYFMQGPILRKGYFMQIPMFASSSILTSSLEPWPMSIQFIAHIIALRNRQQLRWSQHSVAKTMNPWNKISHTSNGVEGSNVG